MGKYITYRHNVMSVNSMNTFFSLRGGYTNNIRDVYFVRGLGEPENLDAVIESIDKMMGVEMSKNRLKYVRMNALPGFDSTTESDFYASMYDTVTARRTFAFKNVELTPILQDVLLDALDWIVKKYAETKQNASPSMNRNFGTKILYWLDSLMGESLNGWNERSCIKVFADNVVKEQEYLFYLFLTQLGCDVFLLENKKDIQIPGELMSYSSELPLGAYGNTTPGVYHSLACTPAQPTPPQQEKKESQENRSERVVVKIPERTGRKKHTVSQNMVPPPAAKPHQPVQGVGFDQVEKSFEELAQLASSVVLIAVHDTSGEVVGTGSGIMIGRKGYILTNHHVISGGRFFSVRIEDDDEAYPTDEVIKYNSATDLAVIRINRELKPISIYCGNKKLVRGQKVVAIGSPLGLFNSVSDGIISGFRTIHDADMIQFTAPISPGSSGGAVLNMQGEIIGISTAGIDSGQNINLAVGYESILLFARGFLT